MHIFTEIKENPKKYLFILICSFLVFALVAGVFLSKYDRPMYVYLSSAGYPVAHYIGHTYSLKGEPIKKITESRHFNDSIFKKGEYRGKYHIGCYECKFGHYRKGEKTLFINFPAILGIAIPASVVCTILIAAFAFHKQKRKLNTATASTDDYKMRKLKEYEEREAEERRRKDEEMRRKIEKLVKHACADKINIYEAGIKSPGKTFDMVRREYFDACFNGLQSFLACMYPEIAERIPLALQNPQIAGLPNEFDVEYLNKNGISAGAAYAICCYAMQNTPISPDEHTICSALNYYQNELMNEVLHKPDV